MATSVLTYRCPYCENIMEFNDVSDGDVVRCTAPLCRREFKVNVPTTNPEPHIIDPTMNGGTESGPGVTEHAVATPVVQEPQQDAFASEAKDKTVLASFGAPMFRRYPFYFIAYTAMVVLGALGLISAAISGSGPLAVLGLVLLGVGLFLLIRWRWKIHGQSVLVTPSSLIVNSRVASEPTIEIHHDAINSIDIFQPWFCKQLNTGGVMIAWGSKPDTVYLDTVDKPQALVALVRQQRETNGQERT